MFVDLFTGEVSSVQNTLEGAGANDQFANTVQVQAIGVLGLLVKRYAGSVSYPQEFDGQRIERILEETLYVVALVVFGLSKYAIVNLSPK